MKPNIPESQYDFAKRPYTGDTANAAVALVAKLMPALGADAAKLRLLSEGLADHHTRRRDHAEHSRFNRIHVACEEFVRAISTQ
jgi:hypothetical protein